MGEGLLQARKGDHPRVCGEKVQPLADWMMKQGSPPRMRGKALSFPKIGNSDRITPAYAGKSIQGGRPYDAAGDHPRVCGEKEHKPRTSMILLGSPPRMRGKAMSSYTSGLPPGITPAYAGKRINIPSEHNILWDHPRVCGEKKQTHPLRVQLVGSPPRMRGKAFIDQLNELKNRITPAYAGKSVPAVMLCRRR